MKTKKLFRITLTALVLLCILCFTKTEASAAKKPVLNYKTITIGRPGSFNLKLKNAKGSVRWSSSKKSVVTVNSKGKITGKSQGSAYVIAKYRGKSYKCKVNVKNMALKYTSLNLASGQRFAQKLVYKNSTYKATWTTSNKAVATVTSAGVIQAVAPGSCYIKVKCNGKVYSCSVTVKKPVLEFSNVAIAYKRSKTIRLLNANGPVTWSSSNPAFVKVDSNGKILGNGVGQAVVTATYLGQSYSCSVYVQNTFVSDASANPYIVDALRQSYPVEQNQGKILLAGSSSMDHWMWFGCESAFAPTPIVNMGISNSTITNWSNEFVQKLVLDYKPKAVALYVGSNDIGYGTTSGIGTTTFNKLEKLCSTIMNKLPSAEIFIVSTCPCYSRADAWKEIISYNALTLNMCNKSSKMHYIDLTSVFFAGGKPAENLFANDKLHPNEAGYKVWKSIVVPEIKKYVK